jgi:hypothetical protein
MSIPAEIAAQFVKAADPAHIRGAEIMDMLKSGRGSEVTEQMLDMGDPALNARLNEYLYKNSDIPMDTASRMARAGDIGFDVGTPLYHGSNATDAPRLIQAGGYTDVFGELVPDIYGSPKNPSFQSFSMDRAAPSNDVKHGEGIYMAENPELANSFASGSGYELLARDPERFNGEAVVRNPTNIRSRFARFDPRLSHLKNLSASFGAGLLGANMMPNNDGSR